MQCNYTIHISVQTYKNVNILNFTAHERIQSYTHKMDQSTNIWYRKQCYLYCTTIRENLKVQHIVDEIQSYQKNWLQHVRRMVHSRIPSMALKYKPKGKHNVGRPKIKWRDHQHNQNWVSTGQDAVVLHLDKFRWWWYGTWAGNCMHSYPFFFHSFWHFQIF